MAFSSIYKEYVKGAEMPVSGRKREDGALKRYESVEDSRAWSMDHSEKAKFIHDIIKQTPPLSDAVKCLNSLTKEELVDKIKILYQEMKAKDVELDKIHKLFKITSKKLENMNDIIKEKDDFETKCQKSEAELKRLRCECKAKGEQVKTLEKEVETLNCCPSAKIDTEKAWNDIKDRANMYDNVVKERNVLKDQLCKMTGVEVLLRKLKKRADEADKLEQEVAKLQCEMQRAGQGACGDATPEARPDSACNQCDKYCDKLQRCECLLDGEIKKSAKTCAEANFLRARVRDIDVMEAERILYKRKYEELLKKLACLKETFAGTEMKDKQCGDLEKQLKEALEQLKESERHAAELISVMEKLELDLKEREAYIASMSKQTNVEAKEKDAGGKAAGDGSENYQQSGKVQTIVRKLSKVEEKPSCNFGFDNCECGNVGPKCSSDSPKQPGSLNSCHSSTGSVHQPSQEILNNLECSPQPSKCKNLSGEAAQLNNELAEDEIRLLRQQNNELDCQLKTYKEDLSNLTSLMNQLDDQRKENSSIEQEVQTLQDEHEKEADEMQSSFRNSMEEKDTQIKSLCTELKCAMAVKEKLENDLETLLCQVQQVEPSDALKGKCEFDKSCNVIKDEEKIEELSNKCEQYRKQACEMTKRIKQLEAKIKEHEAYSKCLADQLSNRAEIPRKKEPGESRELFVKAIKDLKQQYEDLKREKLEMIRCYENKLKALLAENRLLQLQVDHVEKSQSCECDWDSSENGDVLLQKVAKFGFESLTNDELEELHDRVRSAMMQLKRPTNTNNSGITMDYYTKIADELRTKYNLDNSLPFPMDPDDVPVKDFDMCSAKTLPSILRSGARKSSTKSNKSRARSEDRKNPKSVSISRRVTKK